MTEDEFVALLAIEGKKLTVSGMGGDPQCYLATVRYIVPSEKDRDPRYAIGNTRENTVQQMIRNYYADNR